MKLFVPPLELTSLEGFTDEKDIFKRKDFGEKLTHLIKSTDDEWVLAIDAPWGEGKTTFIKMWKASLQQDNDISCVLFDAFEHDYQQDPFLAIAREIYDLIGDKEVDLKESFKKKSSAAFKTLVRVAIRVGLKASIAGIFDDTVFEGSGAEDDISSTLDQYVAEQLESVKKDKESLEYFKAFLKELPQQLGKKKLVFIIDELDRCRPPFALEILEKIKHLFSVPNVVFVLSLNREQLEESIRCEYGRSVDASQYLQKFINIWAHLPKLEDKYMSDAKQYICQCLNLMDLDSDRTQYRQDMVETLADLADYYHLSLRAIERILTNLAILKNSRGVLDEPYTKISVYLAVIKVHYPSSYKKLSSGELSYKALLEETELNNLRSKQGVHDPQGHFIKWILFYSMSAHEDIEAFKTRNNFPTPAYYSKVDIPLLCKWMNMFQ